MKIAIRMDDITPDMDWKKFFAFKELLDLYQVKPLLGVVPDNKDPILHKEDSRNDFWQYIEKLQQEGYIIALHGFTHVYDTKKGGIFPLNNFSEYAGVPYEIQEQRIRYGREIFNQHHIHTDIFMAPAHSYDKNTLDILKKYGFYKMTDGFGDKPYHYFGMNFYPISFKLSESLKKKKGYTTMVVHSNTIENLEFYKNIFEHYRNDLIDYSEYLTFPVVKRSKTEAILEYILAKVKFFLVRLKSR